MKISLEEYKIRLEAHNWFYEMEEETNTYLDGRDEHKELKNFSKLSEAHHELYEQIKEEKTTLVFE